MNKILKRSLLAFGAIVAMVSCEPVSGGEGAGRAEWNAAKNGDTVTVETYVQAKTYANAWGNVNLYCQDKDGGYYAYRMPVDEAQYESIKVGQKIKLTGSKTEWAGWVEFAEGSCTFEMLEGTWKAPATDCTANFASNLLPYQNMFIEFKGLTVEASVNGEGWTYAWNGAGDEGDDIYYFVSYQGTKYQFLVETDLCNSETDVYKAAKTMTVGAKVDLQGYLAWYEGQPNLHTTSIKLA